MSKSQTLFEYIGQRLYECRHNAGRMSQLDFARAIGVSANTVSRWESGTYQMPLDKVIRAARFFGLADYALLPLQKEPDINGQLAAELMWLGGDEVAELVTYAQFIRFKKGISR